MTDKMLGPYVKLERANTHIHQLVSEIEGFWRREPYRVVQYTDPSSRRDGPAVEVRELVPTHWPAIIGDAIHNLRASLDLALNAAVDPAHFGEARVPILKVADNRYSDGVPNVRGLSTRLRERLVQMQPYNSGDYSLRHIHDLDIRDKHQGLVLAASASVALGIRGSAHGPNVRMSGFSMGPQRVPTDKLGIHSLGFSIMGGQRFRLEGDTHFQCKVVLREFEPFEGMEIDKVLFDLLRTSRQFVEVFVLPP